MYPRFVLALTLVVLNYPVVNVATYFPALEPRTGGVCGSGIYGELAPILAAYPIAEAFCSAVYPVKCTTAKAVKRQASTPKPTATTTTTKPSSTSSSSKTTTKPSSTTTTTTSTNQQSSAWSKCQAQGANVVSTLCSCIEVPKVSYFRETSITSSLSWMSWLLV